MSLTKSGECEALLHYTEGIQTLSRQIIKTKKCTLDAPYQCAGCGKNFCAYHVVTDTKPHSSLDINKKDTDLYCKNCHPMKI